MDPSRKQRLCPSCGFPAGCTNPLPTVDIIIERDDRILLIRRRNEPRGWAIPGGFVDYGESVEAAALREAREETSLSVRLVHLLGVYSDPARDERMHTISTVFVARGEGMPRASDDAESLAWFDEPTLPDRLVFDHEEILRDYFAWRTAPSLPGTRRGC